ncbi:MAG TPA: four helix bundle protein [Chitinophagaceae bacterium]|nr:four helix bundle protein [Chitinophagaceae bacterium]
MKYDRKITDRTFDFAVEIVNLCSKLEKESVVAKIVLTQLVRSATSVGANIEEAQAPQSRKDFIHKASISLKEARETLYWLKILKSSELKKINNIDGLINEADEIVSVLTIMIRNAKGRL